MPAPLVRLPSLDLLRGFVAVGRRMSITRAAEDLCLTQSAVSRQIQALEEALGHRLLVRGHRSLAFTPAGERLFRWADGMVRQFQEIVFELKEPAARPVVTVGASAGVAGLWLIPRLGAFLRDHPDIEVRVSADSRIADLESEGIDLAIRYGPREQMPAEAEHLFDEDILPVAHPALGLTALDGPAALEKQVLLEFDGPYRPWLQWSGWLASQGWEGVRPRGILRFNQYDQMIQAAVAGQGIALGRRALVSSLLAEGRLIALAAPRSGPAIGHAYWLLRGETDPGPEVRQVKAWIRAEATALRRS